MNMVPKRKYGVIRSPSNHAANTIVVIGLKYTQLVVATGPRCFITQFHNTKQANDATQPRKRRLVMTLRCTTMPHEGNGPAKR